MTFEEMLQQTTDILRRRGRVSYRALKRQFDLDEDYLNDLKEELLYAYPQSVDADERGLAWTGEMTAVFPVSVAPSLVGGQEPMREPHAYTPPHLAAKISTSRSILEGERKQVTVLFADLKGSTELIEDLDPEEVRALLDPALYHMMDAVHRYEGTVNQVMGDGIMALFGAPLALEDHAIRACYAALAMQMALSRYADEVRQNHGIVLQSRIGLNAGEVVVRTIANDLHMDYSAVGVTTVLAARMEQLAKPDTILLPAATLRLVEGLVHVNALGLIPVKGMTEPVEVYELTGGSSIKRRLQAAVARGLTQFVGRETEIKALDQALEQAGAGHGQVVAAVGEAGVGKSRLVYEFIHSHRTQGWLMLESDSVSYGKATPYFPLVDLLKRYVHVEGGDDSRTIRAKVTGHILTLDETLQETISPLLSLLDALPEDNPFLQLDPPQRRQRTLDALKRLLLRESQVQPLLLVCEDLHWIDSETQALLDSLVESLVTAQLLLLVNYRTEYQHSWGSKTYYTQLCLDPLPPKSADELLAALLGNDPSLAPLKKLLIERTEGNPFFLEESVRTLVETERFVGEPGAYRLAQALPTIQVPPTVQAVLAARIDRLSQEEKQLLQTAAVIGTEVSFSLLQAIAELSEEALQQGLTHLQAAEFLYETSLFPERVYTFKHALTHEVAYSSLLQQRRRSLHTRIVEAIERLYRDRLGEQVEWLAHHACQGEIWDKAVTYFHQAGAKATVRSANREAVAYFEQALAALTHLPESHDTLELGIDLRFDLKRVIELLGDLGRLFDHMCEAETLAKALDDRRRLGRVSAYMSNYFWVTGNQDRAVEFGRRASAMAAALEDVALQMLADFHLSLAYHALGNYRQAIDILRQNVETFRGALMPERLDLSGPGSVVLDLTWLVWCLAERGELAAAIDGGEEAVRMAETDNRPSRLIAAYFGLGIASLRKGNLQRAISVLERGLELSRVWDMPAWFAPTASALGSAHALSGDVTEALPLLEQAVKQDASLKIMVWHALLVASLSEGYLLAGRLDDAIRFAKHALDLSRKHQERGHQAWTLRLLGEIHSHREPPEVEASEAHYQQALTLADELGMRPLQAHCHRGLGTLYSHTGQSEQARAELSTAIDMYRDMEMTFWLSQTGVALEQLKS